MDWSGPVSGTLRVSSQPPNPAGGPPWAVRSWHPRPEKGNSTDRAERCTQVGAWQRTCGAVVWRRCQNKLGQGPDVAWLSRKKALQAEVIQSTLQGLIVGAFAR